MQGRREGQDGRSFKGGQEGEGKGRKISPLRSFLKVGAYASYRLGSSLDPNMKVSFCRVEY